MRVSILINLNFICGIICGQVSSKVYQDHFGRTLELKSDSSFKADFKFELSPESGIGQWTKTRKTIRLKFFEIYDTLIREGKKDTLVLSKDEFSNRLSDYDWAKSTLFRYYFVRSFRESYFEKGNRLFIITENGRVDKSRKRLFLSKRRFIIGYKKKRTFFKRIK